MGILIGAAQLLISISYFITSAIQAIKAIRNSRISSKEKTLRILQVIFAPLVIFLSGIILIFQGWRLDPILQFQQVIVFMLLNYLIWRDWNTYSRKL